MLHKSCLHRSLFFGVVIPVEMVVFREMTSIKMQAPFFFLLGLIIREAFKKVFKKKVMGSICILGKLWGTYAALKMEQE